MLPASCGGQHATLRGPAPLEVGFYDASLGAIREFRWSFGDGHEAEGEEVAHVYEAPGRYRARLLVRGPGGATLVRHATSTPGVARVIEEPVERFLRRQERAYPRWPLVGLSFFAIRDARARVSSLAARPVAAPAAGEAPPASPAAGL